jgi:hypothetical protein
MVMLPLVFCNENFAVAESGKLLGVVVSLSPSIAPASPVSTLTAGIAGIRGGLDLTRMNTKIPIVIRLSITTPIIPTIHPHPEREGGGV